MENLILIRKDVAIKRLMGLYVLMLLGCVQMNNAQITEVHCNQIKGVIKGMGSVIAGGLCAAVVAEALEKTGFKFQRRFFPDIGFIAGSVFGVWLAAKKRAEKKEDEAQGLLFTSFFGVIVPLFYRHFDSYIVS